MSPKPIKKSDQNKEWLKGRGFHSKTIRIHPEYHLIVTEGTDTEPLYFGAIRDEINARYKDRIRLDIDGVGDNTVNLFYRAKDKVEKSPNGFKHVWIVYDTDDFPPDHINQVAYLCSANTTVDTKYHAIWSNQCIELWFLLHFEFYHSDIHRSEYWPKLTENLITLDGKIYTKDRNDMYKVLKPYIKTAIKNAKKLATENKGKTPALSAPGTEVYRFIEELEPYLELKAEY